MPDAPLKVKNAAELLKYIEDNDIQYIDFNFTDPRGKWQHTAQHVNTFDKDMIAEGIMFDGSSIAGWKSINESDMNLRPDLNKVCVDPFSAQPTLKIFCDVIEPSTDKPYHRCPRSIAKAAEAYLKKSGHADVAYMGPEAEFFVFDDVRMKVSMNEVSYKIDSGRPLQLRNRI